jgi:PQQ enzyme repeat
MPAPKGVACCDLVNRGAVYANGRVFFNTLDNQTLAVDAKTGKELWRVKLGNIKLGESKSIAGWPVSWPASRSAPGGLGAEASPSHSRRAERVLLSSPHSYKSYCRFPTVSRCRAQQNR